MLSGIFTVLSKVNIKVKIAIILLVNIGTSGALIYFAITGLSSIGTEIKKIAEEDIPLTERVSKITVHQLEQAIHFERSVRYGYIMDTESNEELRKSAKERYFQEKEAFIKLAKQVDKEIIEAEEFSEHVIKVETDPVIVKEFTKVLGLLKKIEKAHHSFDEQVYDVFKLFEANKVYEAEKLAEKVEKEEDQLDKALEALLFELVSFTRESTLKAQVFEEQTLQHMVIVAIIGTILSTVFSILMMAAITIPLGKMKDAMKRMANGNKTEIPSLKAKDEIGDIGRALERIYGQGQSAIRVQIALDNASSSAMVTDLNMNIVYGNTALFKMFEAAQNDISKIIPDFNHEQLIGSQVENFLETTDYKRGTFENITDTHKATYHLAGHIYDIAATPVLTPEGERLGTVIEWEDVTELRQKEKQEQDVLTKVENIVGACARGDFSNRMETQELDGFTLQLAQGINSINDVSEKGLTEIRDSMQAVSEGNLNQTINGDYKGLFDEIKQACNQTLAQLNNIIQDATEAAQLAGQGDFSKVIDINGKKGFMLELAKGINAINEISDRGLTEIRTSVQAIAQGDLNKKITGRYEGMFEEIKQAFNETLEKLGLLIHDVTKTATASSHGDFSSSIALEGKAGFMQELAESINAINEVSNKGLSEIRTSVQAIAKGDLTKTIDEDYEGLFDEIKVAFNTTLEQLSSIIDSATEVSAAASRGDFTHMIDASGKDGFMLELANGVNGINEVSNQGLSELKDVITALSKGDLSIKMTRDYEGMFDEIKISLNETIDTLGSITGQIQYASRDVASASREISQGSQDLSQRTETQAASLQRTAASMEHIAQTVKTNSENANQANQLSINAREAATKGGKVVSDAVQAMSRIEISSRKISDITNVIDEIAFQINLLALNAAVEAARAGEAGKGFEVVAAEVRKLAQRSAKAAKDIEVLIEESGHEVQQGSRLVTETGQSLEGIVGSVTNLADIIGEIASASKAQSSGASQVNNAIGDMDTMTQQNSALVEENFAACQSLQERAAEMQERMGFFKIDKSADKKDKVGIVAA